MSFYSVISPLVINFKMQAQDKINVHQNLNKFLYWCIAGGNIHVACVYNGTLLLF